MEPGTCDLKNPPAHKEEMRDDVRNGERCRGETATLLQVSDSLQSPYLIALLPSLSICSALPSAPLGRMEGANQWTLCWGCAAEDRSLPAPVHLLALWTCAPCSLPQCLWDLELVV